MFFNYNATSTVDMYSVCVCVCVCVCVRARAYVMNDPWQVNIWDVVCIQNMPC